ALNGLIDIATCGAGNGGNGGRINILTVDGANVEILGRLNASGGRGATLPASCTSEANGTNGQDGTININTFTPSAVEFELNEDDVDLESGETFTLSASGADEFGDEIDPVVSWSTSDEETVEITESNETHATIRGLLAGSADVTATVGGLENRASVVVTAGDFHHVQVIQPADTTLRYNHIGRFEIDALDFGGNRVPIPLSRKSEVSVEIVQSESEGTGIIISCFTVNPCIPGAPPYQVTLFAGRTPGDVVVRVTHLGQSTDVVFNIEMPEIFVTSVRIEPQTPQVVSGSSLQLYAIGIDSDGDEAVFETQWSAENLSGSGSITATGFFTASEPGAVNVSTSINGIEASTQVAIVAGSAHHVNVTGPLTAEAGQTVVFTATLRDANNNELGNYNGNAPEYTWQTTSGTIYTNGTLLATQAGQVTITATLVQNTTLSVSRTITINPSTPTALRVLNSGVEIQVGSVYNLQAALVDGFGNQVSTTPANWIVINATGRADLNGNSLRPVKTGYITVHATAVHNDSLTATGTFNTVHGQAVELEISPTNSFVRPPNTVLFTARGFDAFGNEFSVSASNVEWSVSGNAARISQNGLFTPVSPGIVTVSATLGQAQASTTVTILESLSEGATLAVRLNSELPDVVIPGVEPRRRTSVASAGGLSGLFTAGGSAELFLIGALAILLVGLVAYYISARE
ncbi:Ig-like domain-containing protein, partial [Candidatus Micrarchaeota archaeon]|nr:Ig-like domain-containing protein [Candidatus Micrarchaeota archaeon]